MESREKKLSNIDVTEHARSKNVWEKSNEVEIIRITLTELDVTVHAISCSV